MTMMSNIIQFQQRVQPVRFRRPRLLVQAAKAGLSGWNRKRDLRRILRSDELPLPGAALPRLYAEEERLDLARRDAEATYDVQRHILVLVGIIAETAASTQRPVIFPGTTIQARP